MTGCAAEPPSHTVLLNDAAHRQRITLALELIDARDQNAMRRDGTLTLTSLNDGQQQMLHIVATGDTAPIWLRNVDNQMVFITDQNIRRIVDGPCTRDASGLPPVSIRDVLGPLQGFRQNDTIWSSTHGGAAWTTFTAHARINAQNAVTQMDGRGQGKVLLPSGDVITATMTWKYMVDAYPVTIVAPTRHCETQAFDDISFPAALGTSSAMGGALVFSSNGSLIVLRDALRTHWEAQGFKPIIRDENAQSVTIEIANDTDIIRAFLVETQPQIVDITVIRVIP